MLILDASTKLQLVLGAAHTTNALEWTVSYLNTVGHSPALATGTSNGMTDVDMLAAAAGRAVKHVTLYNADTWGYVPVFEPVASSRVPDFHQLDLRVDKTWNFRRWTLSTFLDVQNVYNHANAEFTAYSFDYRQRGVTRGLPILPSLGVRGEF